MPTSKFPLEGFLYKYRKQGEIMKITELTGYRNNPIYQLALKSFSIGNFESNMKNAGYAKHMLGSGLYGVVFEKPNTNFVYKLFDAHDDGYLKFLKFVLKNQNNKHVPKVMGQPIRLDFDNRGSGKGVNINAYIVKLERLEETNLSNPHHAEQYKLVMGIISSLEKIRLNDPMRSGAMNYLNKIETQYPDLVNILEDINDLSPSEMDMHSGNVMMRGNDIVITDPYAGGIFS